MPYTAIRRLLVLFLVGLSAIVSAEPTTMITGTWAGNMSVSIVSAEINGKNEIICLPRLEFKEVVDRQALSQRMREGIKRQEAIFHLYHDGIGTPIRKNNMLFSADVFLKEAKATYIGLLREWGYSFKVNRKPPMNDPDYLQTIAAEGMIGSLQSPAKKPPVVKPSSGNGNPPGQPVQGNPAGNGSGSPYSGPLPDELMDIKEKYEVMPAGILHPSVRKAKQELDAKIRELKNRPYRAEIPRVDPVRWASGKMGLIEKDGGISGAVIEGQKIPLQALVPTGDWWKPALRNALASQPCEFILQRDRQGLEARRQQKPILADIYFSDLGQNWEEWLKEQGVPATFTHQADWATGSVELKVQVVNGVWDGLMAPSISRIRFSSPPKGVNENELVRLPPNEFAIKDYKAFCGAVNKALQGKPVAVSLLFCLNGRPYDELGQKRALRVYLLETKDTLQLLMKRLADVKDASIGR